MKIVHYLFDSSKTDQVCFTRDGESYSELLGGGRKLIWAGRLVGETRFTKLLDLDAKHETGFSICATRSYLRADGDGNTLEQEVMFGNITSNEVTRFSTQGKQPPLKLAISAASLTCLRTSLDGRYIAVGNGDGQFEVWNMDMAPYRTFRFDFPDQSPIADMCFSRSNLELYVSTTSGITYVFRLTKDEFEPLGKDVNWPNYSIDTQSDGAGIIFGGEYGTLWTLNLKGVGLPAGITIDDVPFLMEHTKTVSGGGFWRVAAMPQARVGCLQTTVGGYVAKVRFLRDDLICVFGPNATEVWSLGNEEPQMVARKPHDDDYRLLGFGGNSHMVRVALGRLS